MEIVSIFGIIKSLTYIQFFTYIYIFISIKALFYNYRHTKFFFLIKHIELFFSHNNGASHLYTNHIFKYIELCLRFKLSN